MTAEVKKMLNPDSIMIVDSGSKADILDKLSAMIMATGHCSAENLRESIEQREELMSTGIGMGLGIPHVRLKEVSEMTMAVAVCRKPVKGYESIDGKPVHFVFMIVASDTQHSDYILTLSQISQLAMNDDLKEKLLSCENKQDVYDYLTGF